MKKELLSPAGDMESLKAAVHAGADAVYVGGKKFGARKFAHNFDDDALKIAVDYAHLYGVKLYVTVNTMIYEEEMERVLEYVSFLYSIHVDAVIVQDIGLIYEIRKCIPGMEIHASTQMHNYCEEGCRILEELGVTRVVLARELTLEEVSKLSTPLEKEVFIHGAICISYSGQCLFSSLVMGRSGNRGECAGMCRLNYSLERDDGVVFGKGKYLLSPRELCTISRFQELMESDVTCFKIEGRMKSPAYVYLVTKIYRTLMNQFERGEPLQITEKEFEELEVLYNRKFTEGHLFGKKDSELMNIESPNHMGVSLGKTLQVTKDKIEILLERDIHQNDGIRFVQNKEGMMVNFLYNEKGLLIREAQKGERVFVDNKVGLTAPSEVLKTSDSLLMERLTNYPLKRIPISMKFRAVLGEALTLEVRDENLVVSCSCGEAMEAKQRSTTQEEVYAHLERLGNTPYSLKKADISISNNAFIPMRFVNELRREAIEELTRKRISRESKGNVSEYVPSSRKEMKKDVKLCCLVRTEEQLLVALSHSLARIYVTDLELYQKYASDYPFLYYRRDRLSSFKPVDSPSLVTEFSGLSNSSHSIVTDYYLNVSNVSYLKYLSLKHVECATVSVEASVSDTLNLASRNDTDVLLEVLVYGRVELMMMKHCILHMFTSDLKCDVCHRRYHLVDRNQERYPLIMNCHLTHLFSSKKEWFQQKELTTLLSSGIDFIRVEFFDEKKNEVENILEKYSGLLQK